MSPPRSIASPFGMVLQPEALLVPGRLGYVAGSNEWVPPGFGARFEIDPGKYPCLITRRRHGPGGESHASLCHVSVTRWDLSGLTERELDDLSVAIDAQRARGVGR